MSILRFCAPRLLFALLILSLLRPLAHAQAPGEPGAVKLPPLIVEDAKNQPQWLYATAGGVEYLSLCSSGVTQRYIESRERQMQLLHLLVPEEFLLQLDASSVIVLYSQGRAQTTTSDAVKAMLAANSGAGAVGGFIPNLRLSDRDTHATFAYVDEDHFEADHIIVAENHVHYLLEQRVPLLPAWLIEAVDATYRHADFVGRPITLGRSAWIDPAETENLLRGGDRPRVMLGGSELFAPDALRGEGNHHTRRVAALQSEVTLFYRWALDSGPETRDALWRFVARTTEEPATEKVFMACFGFDYAELRDRLSDYLGQAVREPLHLDPSQLPSLPRIKVRAATPNEVARLRGEWERLAIRYVKDAVPQYSTFYAQQARRTLHRAYDTGDRDPRLLATLGLLEIDEGDPVAARPFLEAAATAGVVRPRVYYEIARLRFAALKRDQPAERLFSYVDLAIVFEPLRRAAQQAPALPEVFALFAEAWVRCKATPEAGDFALLEQGARNFSPRANVSLPLALALARHGRLAQADALLALSLDYIVSDEQRARFTQLRSALKLAQNKE